MQKQLNCYKCGSPLGTENISFRTTCDKCFADQHVCNNCRFHAIGRRNECRIPDTDFVADRAKNNFCDELKIKEGGGSSPEEERQKALERAKKLLGG